MRRLKRLIADVLTSRIIGFLVQIFTRDRISFHGIIVPTRSPEISLNVKSQIFFGLYEKQEATFVEKYLPRDLPVIELGSSLGVITCLAARKVNSTIIAVEVNARLIEVVRQTLETNGVVNYTLLNVAIAGHTGSRNAFFNSGSDNTSGFVTEDPGENSICVPVESLSGIVSRFALNEYSLLCDIEGAEATMLFTDHQALANCRFIIIELHKTRFDNELITVGRLVDRLRELGFDIIAEYGPVVVANKKLGEIM